MCGIAGLFLDPSVPAAELRQRVGAMLAVQRHRGPDDLECWSAPGIALGAVRLAVTGGAQEGCQPITDRRGGRTVFNGEIYDFRSLALCLELPADRLSDGAVLAELLAAHGPARLASVHGMFAAAHYDPASGRLLLVRDAVGKKPLYLRRTRQGWVFGSTVAAVVAGSGPLTLREQAIPEYLCFRSVGGNNSAYQEVVQLPAGSWLELAPNGHQRAGRWWQPPATVIESGDPECIVATLDGAVARRIPEEYPAACFLSGGLDSSLVAIALQRQRREVPSRFFIVGYDVAGIEDERTYARRAAAHVAGETQELTVCAAEVPELLEAVTQHTEDPIQDPVTVPTLALARHAAEWTKVVLTGDGSDEIWGGYARFDRPPTQLDDYLQRCTIFTPQELGLNRLPDSYLEGIDLPPEGLAPLDRILRLEVANRMRNYHLARIDKLTMACGLEARCPFLDREMVELGLSLSAAAKRPGEVAKGLLIAAHQERLPDWLRARRKQPFSVPILAWLRGPLRELIHDLLLPRSAFGRHWVDPLPLLRDLHAMERERAEAAAARLWSLLVLEVWQRGVVHQFTSHAAPHWVGETA